MLLRSSVCVRPLPPFSSKSISADLLFPCRMQLKVDQTEDDNSLQRTHSVSSSTQTSDADTQPSPQSTSPFSLSHKSISPFPLVIFTRPKTDVVKQGYLGRQERSHLQYFVLRSESHTGPSRLEWYENRETFVRTQSDGGAVLFGSSKQGWVSSHIVPAPNKILCRESVCVTTQSCSRFSHYQN